MTTPEIFALTAAEKQSPVWQKLLRQLQKMLATARECNDNLMREDMTNRLRGEIDILKTLIALNEDRPPYDG